MTKIIVEWKSCDDLFASYLIFLATITHIAEIRILITYSDVSSPCRYFDGRLPRKKAISHCFMRIKHAHLRDNLYSWKTRFLPQTESIKVKHNQSIDPQRNNVRIMLFNDTYTVRDLMQFVLKTEHCVYVQHAFIIEMKICQWHKRVAFFSFSRSHSFSSTLPAMYVFMTVDMFTRESCSTIALSHFNYFNTSDRY